MPIVDAAKLRGFSIIVNYRKPRRMAVPVGMMAENWTMRIG